MYILFPLKVSNKTKYRAFSSIDKRSTNYFLQISKYRVFHTNSFSNAERIYSLIS